MNDSQSAGSGIPWPPLYRGTLIKRYKRFLADVRLDNGDLVTAHCSNSGAMTTCAEPGRPVFLSFHDRPKRKLKYTWEIIDMPGSLVGVNTLVPNRLVARAIETQQIHALKGYRTVKREVPTGQSRLDLLLTDGERRPCYVEVKNCTLVQDGVAAFPDAVTKRGLKHLEELMRLVASGCRGVVFYLVQRMDAGRFQPADHIDPAYGKGLRRATRAGVEVLAYDVVIDIRRITIHRRLPVDL